MTLALTDSRLFPAVAALNAEIGTESVTTTAAVLDNTVRTSFLTVSGTMTGTLADGTYLGQRKRVQCISAASTPAYTLTVNTPESASGLVCASTFVFNAVGQAVDFQWTGSKWRVERIQRAGTTAVVVGTTVLTGLNLSALYALSVTGTVSSTTTKGIPDASSVGEIIMVTVTTAASIPSGTISLTGVKTDGTAGTTLGTVGATANYAQLMWMSSGWVLLGASTLAIS